MNVKSDHDNDIRIRSNDAIDLSLWELPEVSGNHVVALETRSKPDDQLSNLAAAELREVGLALQKETPADVVTVSEAESIREAAHQEGLLQGLVEGREQGYPEGYEKGLAEGREKGYQEALEQGKAEIDQAVASLGEMLQALHQPFAQQEQQLEQLIQGLVVKLASSVMDAELQTRSDIIQSSIRDALQQFPSGAGQLQLWVSPSDFEHVQPIAERLSFPLVVESDETVSPGSFRLQSSDSLIESDLKSEFDKLAEQLFSSLSVSEPPQT